MSYKIKFKELDKEYYGYESCYEISYTFERQSAIVILFIADPDESYDLRLDSKTDGYHWLHYFLSQDIDNDIIEDFDHSIERKRCEDLFKTIGIIYRSESKSTALLNINCPVDLDIITKIADIILPRFAKREKFFNDEK